MLSTLNYNMYDVLAQQLFATLVLGRYWPKTGVAHLASAGHLPPLWRHRDGLRDITELQGLPLGVEREETFQQYELTLSPGESLILYTDGVTEARGPGREFYGEDRFKTFLASRTAPPYTEGLIEEIVDWRGETSQNDDITLLEIWKN